MEADRAALPSELARGPLLPSRKPIGEGPIAETDDQRQMPADRRQDMAPDPFGVAIVDDVGEEDEQGPLPALVTEMDQRLVKPALDELRLDIMRGGDHPPQLPLASARRHPAQDPIGETEDPHLVAVLNRHVGER